MAKLTIDLNPDLKEKLEKMCEERGYKKTDVFNLLVREFIEETEAAQPFNFKGTSDFYKLAGLIELGGNSVEDTETAWFE